MPLAAAVAVDKATPQFDKEYSYRVPEGLPVQPGCRVTVPFGRGDRRRMMENRGPQSVQLRKG